MGRKSIKKNKSKQEKAEDVDPIGLLRKLTHTAKSRTNISEEEQSETPSVFDKADSGVRRRASSILEDNGSLSEAYLPEWFEDLTDDNVAAFKDLFDMLDAANTGTLNADSLFEGLKRVDSEITREEVESVLKKLDKDGNGEIDFDEFLFHMTQGDLLDALGGDESDKKRKSKFSRRQRLFYTAITQFSLKHTLGDDYRYLTRLRQPHVLSHYTAGVRLIGLTDRQLAQQMKKMQKTARNNDSPYAKPLPFVSQSGSMKTMHMPGQIGNKEYSSKYNLSKKKDSRKQDTLPLSEVREEKDADSQASPKRDIKKLFTPRESIVAKLPGGHLINKIRTQIMNKTLSTKNPTLGIALGITTPPPMDIIAEEKQKVRRKKTHCGWTSPKVEPVFVPLPVLKIKYIKHRPTIDDLPNIREKATEALDEFYHNMKKACVIHSLEHWEKLYADSIRPKKLLENFRTVYRAYSPHKEEEAFVVCPWIPGPYRHFRRRLAPVTHQNTQYNSPRNNSSFSRNIRTPELEIRAKSSLV